MKKVLVIDDSTTMRRIVKNVVKKLLPDVDLDEAEDGQVAVEKLREAEKTKPFDVILCDINMPNMNGFEVLQYIKKQNEMTGDYEDLYKVMITTEGGKAEVIKALKLGANQYIVKPFTPQVLKEKLSLVL